jgi:hypothetical protein
MVSITKLERLNGFWAYFFLIIGPVAEVLWEESTRCVFRYFEKRNITKVV